MRITNNYSPQFGTAMATQKALVYMNKALNPKQIEKANEIFSSQNGKKPDIMFHLGSFQKPNSQQTMYYLRANVGDTTFKEGFLTSAFDVIKKSAEYVDNFKKA